MGSVIRAEIDYHKYRLLMLIWIIPGFYLYATMSGSESWFVIPCIMAVAMVIQILIDGNIEKRERFYVLLPISIGRIAMTRLFMLLIPCLVLYGVYLIIHLLVFRSLISWNNGGLDLMMFFGLSLCGFSIYFLQRDLLSSVMRGDTRTGIDAINLIVLCAVIIYGIPILLALLYQREIINARSLIFLIFFCGILLLYPTVFTFARRKSYLE